jgi:DEAD/DEAH box helicase domain-containing protein
MHGFSSAAWDAPKIRTDTERIGRTEKKTLTFVRPDVNQKHNFAGITGLKALYRADGELLVYNAGDKEKGFAICLKCGFATSEEKYGDGMTNVPSEFRHHAALYSTKSHFLCWDKHEVPQAFRNQVLAARQTTDALLLDFSSCLQQHAGNMPLLSTLAQALQISGAKILELDSRELGSLVIPAGDLGLGLGAVLYDNVPGGAGHVQELLALEKTWLLETYNTLYVDEKHHETCETACLDCLLTFDAQEPMRRGLLDRRLAINVLEALLNGDPLPPVAANIHTFSFPLTETALSLPTGEAVSSTPPVKTIEERLQRANQNRNSSRSRKER